MLSLFSIWFLNNILLQDEIILRKSVNTLLKYEKNILYACLLRLNAHFWANTISLLVQMLSLKKSSGIWFPPTRNRRFLQYINQTESKNRTYYSILKRKWSIWCFIWWFPLFHFGKTLSDISMWTKISMLHFDKKIECFSLISIWSMSHFYSRWLICFGSLVCFETLLTHAEYERSVTEDICHREVFNLCICVSLDCIK